ncbi:DUF3927 family protein [Escherichia coli]
MIAYCFCEWHCSSRIMSVLADGVLVLNSPGGTRHHALQ